MKALTVQQPWAWAILFAGKDVENRVWRTSHRGPLVIHAGAAMHPDPLPTRLPRRPPEEHIMSALLGTVDLVDIVEESRSRWFDGPYGWVLENSRPFERPIPCTGQRRVWSMSPSQVRAVRRMLA